MASSPCPITKRPSLKSGKAPSTKDFNPSGHAYPDVSAFAVNFEIIEDGLPLPVHVDGTSCAAPTSAGIVSSLNVQLNNGKKTLGFLNRIRRSRAGIYLM